jgi:hypothetical protein
MLAVRLAVLLFAIAACAWFALAYVQARDLDRATELLDQPGTPSRAQTNEILSLLRTAGTLNPDRSVEIVRAQAEERAGQRAAALRTMEAVVRAEPKNAIAWLVLGFVASSQDPPLAKLAHLRVRQLVPPVRPAP